MNEYIKKKINLKVQFGFLKNHSSLQQLLIFLNNVYNSTNTMSQTDVISLDFKKAFDNILQGKLFMQAWDSDIQGNL